MELAWSSGQIAIGTNSQEGFGYSFLIDAELVDLASNVGAPEDQFEIFVEALREARIVHATKRKKFKRETGPPNSPNHSSPSDTPKSSPSTELGASGEPGRTTSSPASSDDNLGGIDMNAIDLDREGAGVDIQFDPRELQKIIDAGIDGLVPSEVEGFAPVIINITPLPSVLPLLGLEPRKKEDVEELSRVN